MKKAFDAYACLCSIFYLQLLVLSFSSHPDHRDYATVQHVHESHGAIPRTVARAKQ